MYSQALGTLSAPSGRRLRSRLGIPLSRSSQLPPRGILDCPNGTSHSSPGHRPGFWNHSNCRVLKGRLMRSGRPSPIPDFTLFTKSATVTARERYPPHEKPSRMKRPFRTQAKADPNPGTASRAGMNCPLGTNPISHHNHAFWMRKPCRRCPVRAGQHPGGGHTPTTTLAPTKILFLSPILSRSGQNMEHPDPPGWSRGAVPDGREIPPPRSGAPETIHAADARAYASKLSLHNHHRLKE